MADRSLVIAVLVPCALAGRLQAQTLYEQAKAASERHQTDSAYALARRAADAEPNRAEVQYLLGGIACDKAQASGGLGAWSPARACKAAFGRAVQLEPDNPNYLTALAQYLEQAPGIAGGDRDSALRLAERLRGIDEGRGTTLMVEVLDRGGAREKARADSIVDAYEHARPNDRGVQLTAAGHWSSTGRYDRAIAIDERLLARDGSDQLARFGIARNLVLQRREPRRALELLQQVVLAPRPPDGQPTYILGAPWWRLGQAYVQLGLPDSARAAFQQALRVNPQFAQAQRSLDSLSRR